MKILHCQTFPKRREYHLKASLMSDFCSSVRSSLAGTVFRFAPPDMSERFENIHIDFIMVSALLLFPPLTKLFPQRSIEAPEPIYRYNTGRKPHGVTNYIDHHIENLKTCLFSDPNIKCGDSGESTIPKWHKTYARLNDVKSRSGCWGRSSSRVEAAAAAMTVRRANNFLALGFSSSCSDAGAGVCCLQNI